MSAAQQVDISGSTESKGNDGLPEEKSIWNDLTLKKVSDFRETSNSIKEKRKALSDELAAKKSELIALGFNKDGIEAAVKYSNLDESDQENFDITYLYVRRATGHPVQDDLFMEAMKQQIEVAKK